MFLLIIYAHFKDTAFSALSIRKWYFGCLCLQLCQIMLCYSDKAVWKWDWTKYSQLFIQGGGVIDPNTLSKKWILSHSAQWNAALRCINFACGTHQGYLNKCRKNLSLTSVAAWMLVLWDSGNNVIKIRGSDHFHFPLASLISHSL